MGVSWVAIAKGMRLLSLARADALDRGERVGVSENFGAGLGERIGECEGLGSRAKASREIAAGLMGLAAGR